MAVSWVCACGERFAETGSASGWGRWRVHLRGHRPGCKRVGLVDDTSGEVVVGGDQNPLDALHEAERKGFVDPNRPRVRPRAAAVPPTPVGDADGSMAPDSPRPPAPKGASPAGNGAAASPRNLEGVIPYQRIALHPRVYMQKAIVDDFLRKETGEAYGWDSADLGEWVNNMLDVAFAVVMRQHLMEAGRSSAEVSELLRQGLLSRLIATARAMSPQEIRTMLHDQGLAEAAGLVGGMAENAQSD